MTDLHPGTKDITGNAFRHIRFNEDGSINCAFPHSSKAPKAKRVGLMVTPQGRRAPTADGSWLMARDGNTVGLDSAACGTHVKVAKWKHSISADMVTDLRDSPGLLMDYAVRRYEAILDEQDAKRKAEDERWTQRRRELAALSINLVDVTADSHHTLLDLRLVDAEDGRPITSVHISEEGGVPEAGTADFGGHVGRGRGNLAWVRQMRQAFEQVEARLVEMYTDIGLEV